MPVSGGCGVEAFVVMILNQSVGRRNVRNNHKEVTSLI